MRVWPAGLIGALWILWILYWCVSARSLKPIRRRQSVGSRAVFVGPMALTAVLLTAQRWPGWLGERLVPGGWTRYWVGVTLVVAGLLLSVWARRMLGGNWSGTVTVKVGHELIQTGPYRWVRHPIYTGMLLALLGSALASGRVHGLLAFLIASIALWCKARVEERWMGEEFGERYAEYRRATWALVPFVL